MMLSAAVITGVVAGTFFLVSNSAVAMEIGRTENFQTVYPEEQEVASDTLNTLKAQETLTCTILDDPLAGGEEPTANELTKEEAALIGVKMVEEIYEVNLDDAFVYMSYDASTGHYPRACWSGDIRMTDKKRTPGDTCYSFSIDAVTGEYHLTAYGRVLEVDVPLGADSSLKESDDFKDLAKSFVEEHQLLNAPVSKVEYNCQGYASNDPDITFYVYAEDGERVNITFSRYDKKVKGIMFEASIRIIEMILNDDTGEYYSPEEAEVESVEAGA